MTREAAIDILIRRGDPTQEIPAVPRCMHGNAPEKDCCARACPVHGTPPASPYGARRGAVIR